MPKDKNQKDPFTDDMAKRALTDDELTIQHLQRENQILTRELQRERTLKQQTLAAVSKSLNNLQDMLTLIQIGGLKDGD